MDVRTAHRLVPAGLAASPALADDTARGWLRDLPELLAAWCERWGLRVEEDTAPAHGAHALVLPVRRDGQPCVLKLSHRGDDTPGEVTALRTWAGRGAVRLLDADAGGDVLLLERLDATRPLSRCPPDELGGVVGRLVRELAVPAPAGTSTARSQAAAIADGVAQRQHRQGRPLPERWVRDAVRRAEHLEDGEHGEDVLVHADLTPDNVLWRPPDDGEPGTWVVIDPKPLSGPPERSVPELLWTLADHPAAQDVRALLRTVCAAGELDEDLARDWVLARTVDYWLWAEEVGLTIDPVRCRRVLTALG